MDVSRRKLLLSTVFGAGYVGLRSLATGLPIALLEGNALADEPDASADAGTPSCTPADAQFLLFLTSGAGDPMNANVPGTYVNGTYHPDNDDMVATNVTMGGKTYRTAKAWASLGADILSRTTFVHHGTYTNAHGDHAKVNRLQGAVQRLEMLISLIAKTLAPCLGTVQQQPVVVSNNLITFNGAVLPTLSPPNLKNVLGKPTGPLGDLQKIRDTHLDALNKLFKESGNTAQRAMLDKYAISQTQARAIKEDVLASLEQIDGTDRSNLSLAARVLFQMKVSPVVVAGFSFGGDNHTDANLENETTQTVESIAAIKALHTSLQADSGLKDKVTIALQNVFGRTLDQRAHNRNTNGRHHNANHHATVIIGSRVKSSVIGGIVSAGVDFRAQGFDAATGAANDKGDVPFTDTLGATGKTLGMATGVPRAVLDEQITRGKVITAALK